MTTPVTSSFAWHDAEVTLVAPDAWLAGEVARFLALQPAGQPVPQANADIVVTPDRRIVWRDGAEVCECAADNDLVMSTVAIVSLRLLERTESVVLHAGAFVADGHALLFSGTERAGKSSLALAAWRRGCALLSDDWVVLEPDHGHVTSFPKPLKTRGGLEGALSPSDAEKTRADVLCGRLMSGELRCMYGRRLEGMLGYATPVPIGALFLIGRNRESRTSIAPANRDTALRAMLEQTMTTRASGLGGVKMLERLLAGGAAFDCRIGDGDVDGAVSLMMSAFRERQTR